MKCSFSHLDGPQFEKHCLDYAKLQILNLISCLAMANFKNIRLKQKNRLQIREKYPSLTHQFVYALLRKYASEIHPSIFYYAQVKLLLLARKEKHDGCLIFSCLWAHQNDN